MTTDITVYDDDIIELVEGMTMDEYYDFVDRCGW